MKSQFKKYAVVAAFGATLAFAQGVPTPATPAVPAAPAVTAPATPAVPAVTAPAVPATPVAEAPAATPAAEEPVAPVAETVPEAPVAEAPVVVEAPAAPVVAEAPSAPVVVKEPMNIKYHMGFRSAFGLSSFRSHKRLPLDNYLLKVQPALSFGLGFVFGIELNDLITVSPELQYTMYRGNNEFMIKNGTDLRDLNEAGIRLHALELPILARFNIKDFAYAEVGPQVGYNIRSVIYQNAKLNEPDELNVIAFGPALGGGIKMGGFLLGIRCYFGILEYAKNLEGYPWTAQVSITQFLF